MNTVYTVLDVLEKPLKLISITLVIVIFNSSMVFGRSLYTLSLTYHTHIRRSRMAINHCCRGATQVRHQIDSRSLLLCCHCRSNFETVQDLTYWIGRNRILLKLFVWSSCSLWNCFFLLGYYRCSNGNIFFHKTFWHVYEYVFKREKLELQAWLLK